MKILQVINAFSPPYSVGGPATAVHQISTFLAKRGHKVVVYTSNIRDDKNLFLPKQTVYNMDGFEVHYLKNEIFRHNLHFYLSTEFIREISDNISDYDIVHVHEYRSYLSLATAYYAWRSSVPFVLQARGQLPTYLSRSLPKTAFDKILGYRTLQGASKVIALTDREREQYRVMGVREEKIAVIPNGIDLTKYRSLPPRGSFRRKHSIRENERIVLYLGRIHKIKGIDFLVKAFMKLMRDTDKSRLIIAGNDDGFLTEIKQLANSLGSTDRILFTGPLYGRDKLEAYVDADIFVLPSRYETFPNAILEAYACSKFVIASNVESISDLVINGKTGSLFRPGDVNDLAKILAYALRNPDKIERIGRQARRFVEKRLSMDKVAYALERLYKEVIGKYDRE